MKFDEIFVKVYGNTKEVKATLAVLENFFDYLRAGKEASERQPVNPVAFGSGKEVAPMLETGVLGYKGSTLLTQEVFDVLHAAVCQHCINGLKLCVGEHEVGGK